MQLSTRFTCASRRSLLHEGTARAAHPRSIPNAVSKQAAGRTAGPISSRTPPAATPSETKPTTPALPVTLLPVASLLTSLTATQPALALVNDRMNTEGAGLPFGINDGILAWVILGTLGTLWAIFFTSQKDLGDFEDPEDGLRIDDD